MRRRIRSVVICILLVISLFITIEISLDIGINAQATTLYVNTTGTGGAYTSIQSAINAANDGETVFVYNGTYFENVVVDKIISLVGEDRNSTIIDAGDSGNVVLVTKNWVNVTGFTLREGEYSGGNAGIELFYVSHCRVFHNNLFSNMHSIYLLYSSSNNIIDNNVSGNSDGILLDYSDWNNITGNNVSGNSYGITLDTSNNNIISNNTANYNAGRGIKLFNSTNNHIINNTAIDSGTYGIYLDSSSYNNITGNNASSNSNWGIRLDTSSRNNITDNNVSYNDMDGIYLDESSYNNLTNNNVYFNGIINFKSGIFFDKSHYNRIIGNTADSNIGEGIDLHWSERNNIYGNNFSKNNHGLYFWGGGWNNITGNNFLRNYKRGIEFGGSSRDNIIASNIIYSHNEYGIYLTSSFYNTIFYNDIINNTVQVYDDDDRNDWDNGYPFGGNYWSDYTGVDLNSTPSQDVPPPDNLGDTPRIIDADSRDNHPLMNPRGNLIVLRKGWNLISIPFIQPDTDMGKVLSPIEGLYDAVQWYNASDTSDPWKHHQISKPSNLNDLVDINHTMGFWINITYEWAAPFFYFGTPPTASQQIVLRKGWNHVGFPSQGNYTRTAGLNNTVFGVDIDLIQWFDAYSKTWHTMGENDFFRRGQGYWIHATTDCVWNVPV